MTLSERIEVGLFGLILVLGLPVLIAAAQQIVA
jgi:hypothetical protein